MHPLEQKFVVVVVVVVGSRDHRLNPSHSTWTGLDFGLGLDNFMIWIVHKETSTVTDNVMFVMNKHV